MPPTSSYPGVRPTSCGSKIRIQFAVGPRGKRQRYSWTLDISPTQRGLAEASRILEHRRERVLHQLPPVASPESNPLIRDLAHGWVAHLLDRGLKTRTINSYISSLNNHWFPTLENLRVRDIRYSVLREIDASNSWTSSKTRANSIGAISSLLQFAYEGDLIDTNPARKFRTNVRDRKRPITYDAFERDTLLDWLDDHAPPTPAMYFKAGFGSAMRVGELLGLRWEKWDGQGFEVDITIQRGEITDTKTHESRYVPILPSLQSSLLAYRKEQLKLGQHHGFVFRNQYGRPFSRSDKLNRWFHKACKETGVRDLMSKHSPYPWRATFVTLAYDAGVDPYLLAEIVGHTVETAQKHYKSHRRRETLRKALEGMG